MTCELPRRNRSFGWIDALGVTGLVGLFVARFVPVARLPFWGCAIREGTGYPCPGCGLTRAAEHVSYGELSAAFDANPLGAFCALAFVCFAVLSAIHLAFAVPMPRFVLSAREVQWAKRAAVGAIIVNYAFMVARVAAPHLR